MKRRIFLVAFAIGNLLNGFSQENIEKIDIVNGWKIQTGDNPEYAKPGFDDTNWKSAKIGVLWERDGYPGYNGIAYYRLKVVIPSTLQKSNNSFKGLILLLGKIDDADITCFNGVELGQTNRKDIDRKYIVPFEMINWDKENVIAVRVNDSGGGGGMYKGPYSIGKCSNNLSDYVNIITDDNLVKNLPLYDSILAKGVFFKTLNAFDTLSVEFRAKIVNIKTNEVIYDNTSDITIGEKADSSIKYSLKLKNSGSYRAWYYLFSKYMNDTITTNTLLVYKDENHSSLTTVKPVVNYVIPGKSVAFDLNNIHLSGYLGDRFNANIFERLLKIDEKGILECFYHRPGTQTWVGDYAGKYLQAASRSWRNTGNEQLKTQMDRIVDILISSQDEDGYLGTYLPADYWTEWDVWTHKEDILGLLSYYSVTGYQPALKTSVKIGDLLCNTFGVKPGQKDIVAGLHVGMASSSILEPMVELYRFTGDKKYLQFCQYILEAYEHPNGPKIISTLNSIGKVNKTANAKAYEMLENFTGIVKLYQVTGNPKLLSAMEKGWNDITAYRLYITGTSSSFEIFHDDFVLPAENKDNVGEGCVSHSWLKFNQVMYYLTGEARYMDELEKTIYNHLFAAENPQTGCVAYYTALQGVKPYRCTIFGHCCLASVPRGIAAIPELAYTKSVQNGFNINFYTSGNFNDNIKASDGTAIPVQVSINSHFPGKGSAEVSIKSQKQANFNLALRVPVWCKDYTATVEGVVYKGIPGRYLNIERTWDANSNIQISFDLNVQSLDGGLSYPEYSAIKTGAQVLAFDKALNPEIEDPDKVEIRTASIRPLPGTELPGSWFGNQVYSIDAYYNNKPVVIKLVPFAEAGQTGGEIRVWIKKKE